MKISFWQIIADHLSTLRNDISGRLSLIDLIIFYALPVVAGIIVFLIPLKVSKDFYNISVTFLLLLASTKENGFLSKTKRLQSIVKRMLNSKGDC